MSLGNILATAAPIAAGYYTGGMSGGFMGLSEGVASGIAAGALTGAGIAALSGGDVLTSGVMGGLGGYSGASMAGAATAAKEAAQGTLTDATFNAQRAAAAGYTGPTSMMQSAGLGGAPGAGMGGLPMGTNNQIGSSLMGAKVPSGPLGSGTMPQANLDLSKAGGYQYNANEMAGQGIGRTQDFSGGMMGNLKSTAIPEAQFGTDYGFSDIATELGGGDASKGYMKAGLMGLPILAAATEPEYETFDEAREAEAYDPYETLNLNDPALDSGIEDVINEDSGLRLYANQGGMVPAYAEGGEVGGEEARQLAIGTSLDGKGDGVDRQIGKGMPNTRSPYSSSIVPGQIGKGSNTGPGAVTLPKDDSYWYNRTPAKAGQVPRQIGKGSNNPPAPFMDYVPASPQYDPFPAPYMGGEVPRQIGKGGPGGEVPRQIGKGSNTGGGMAGALARNQGTSYAQPTIAPTPTTAPSNINIAGADNSSSPIASGGDVGSLNVSTGEIGKSPNVIAAEAAKPKMKTMPNGQEVPIDFRPAYSAGVLGGMQNVPQSHYYDRGSEEWIKGQRPGTFQIGGNNGSGIGNMLGMTNYYAEGGAVRGYAEGGMLEGPGDGMSDSLAAQIDGSQPAALSQGEFVVPADVVSHLGNGSSDAGSKRLYAMMDKVRQARTGTEKQGKEINPERYMPA